MATRHEMENTGMNTTTAAELPDLAGSVEDIARATEIRAAGYRTLLACQASTTDPKELVALELAHIAYTEDTAAARWLPLANRTGDPLAVFRSLISRGWIHADAWNRYFAEIGPDFQLSWGLLFRATDHENATN